MRTRRIALKWAVMARLTEIHSTDWPIIENSSYETSRKRPNAHCESRKIAHLRTGNGLSMHSPLSIFERFIRRGYRRAKNWILVQISGAQRCSGMILVYGTDIDFWQISRRRIHDSRINRNSLLQVVSLCEMPSPIHDAHQHWPRWSQSFFRPVPWWWYRHYRETQPSWYPLVFIFGKKMWFSKADSYFWIEKYPDSLLGGLSRNATILSPIDLMPGRYGIFF